MTTTAAQVPDHQSNKPQQSPAQMVAEDETLGKSFSQDQPPSTTASNGQVVAQQQQRQQGQPQAEAPSGSAQEQSNAMQQMMGERLQEGLGQHPQNPQPQIQTQQQQQQQSQPAPTPSGSAQPATLAAGATQTPASMVTDNPRFTQEQTQAASNQMLAQQSGTHLPSRELTKAEQEILKHGDAEAGKDMDRVRQNSLNKAGFGVTTGSGGSAPASMLPNLHPGKPYDEFSKDETALAKEILLATLRGGYGNIQNVAAFSFSIAEQFIAPSTTELSTENINPFANGSKAGDTEEPPAPEGNPVPQSEDPVSEEAPKEEKPKKEKSAPKKTSKKKDASKKSAPKTSPAEDEDIPAFPGDGE